MNLSYLKRFPHLGLAVKLFILLTCNKRNHHTLIAMGLVEKIAELCEVCDSITPYIILDSGGPSKLWMTQCGVCWYINNYACVLLKLITWNDVKICSRTQFVKNWVWLVIVVNGPEPLIIWALSGMTQGENTWSSVVCINILRFSVRMGSTGIVATVTFRSTTMRVTSWNHSSRGARYVPCYL